KDPMHFEINKGAAAVAALADKDRDDSGGEDELMANYNSGGATKPLALKAAAWNTIPWDQQYGGDLNLGHPGVVWGPARYDAKVTFRLALPDGALYSMRFLEARKVN